MTEALCEFRGDVKQFLAAGHLLCSLHGLEYTGWRHRPHPSAHTQVQAWKTLKEGRTQCPLFGSLSPAPLLFFQWAAGQCLLCQEDVRLAAGTEPPAVPGSGS